jgi:hypothetical protein
VKSFHFSIFLIILCGLAIWQAALIPQSGLVDAVGAKNFPFFIVILFAIFSVIYFFQELSFYKKKETLKKYRKKNVLFFVSGCFVLISLSSILGFFISSIFSSILIARSFGTKINLLSLKNCFFITLVVWILFSVILGLQLGPLFKFLS